MPVYLVQPDGDHRYPLSTIRSGREAADCDIDPDQASCWGRLPWLVQLCAVRTFPRWCRDKHSHEESMIFCTYVRPEIQQLGALVRYSEMVTDCLESVHR